MITLLTLELLIKGLLIAWIINKFEPFQTYVVGTLEGINLGLFRNKPLLYIFFGQIINILVCLKCFSLWVTLLISHNIFIAILASLVAYHYDKWDSSKGVKLW
jgi:hypothetical protein